MCRNLSRTAIDREDGFAYDRLQKEERGKQMRLLITVDGPCATGKTTLAKELARLLHAAVIHTDDFVIPHAQKTEERLSVPGGNCDIERLAAEVVGPWKAGQAVRYRRYDFRRDRMCEPEELPPCAALIIEGSYSNLPPVRDAADLRIFLQASREVREARLRKRETLESLEMFHKKWIPLEDAYFEAYSLPDPGCLVID